MVVDRESVLQWVAAYEDAWRSGDDGAVERLFTSDARYARSPYDPDELHGHAAIRGFWLVDEDATFAVTAEPLAVEGDVAVVRLEVRYLEPEAQEYRDLWVLRFAPDGRVADFEEWAYWPGKAWTAS
ncbi:nuclear transport factor 2 family protein [Isoptericola cucumis]|uniref:YybH family protein n=1 Tax=Isoptericola cucumis TaxID=1776856 RepID=UPI003208F4DC